MLVTTILNKVEKHKGFVYEKAQMVRDEADRWRIEVTVRPRKNGRARCSVCGHPAPCYDRLQPRRFRHVPVLGIAVLLVYVMRRLTPPARCAADLPSPAFPSRRSKTANCKQTP